MHSMEGTLLKGYKLEERIGSGGFGAVYRARQSTIGREVAIKIILPGYANNPDFIRRFESEANLVARLEHPHITPLHDFWRDPDGAYLVMRYLRGGSIRDALKDSLYELNAISLLLDQIASALDFSHRHDVIHRDIKPANILLDEDGNGYLADFGIAKDLTGRTNGKTAPDAVVGSLDYISPEQARNEPVTNRTDIYSLGVTLYEMVTGEHPYKESTTIERLYKHINDPLPKIGTLPDDTQDAINDVIQKATAKNPEHRYPDVLALAYAFREGVGRGSTEQDLSIVEQLTMREQEVLSLIVKQMTNREIADELVVTLGTVKWHITQLYKKLGVRNRVQAIVRARELNLIVNGDAVEFPIVAGSSTVISLPEPENPYKGLHAFQMTDTRDFFGRSDLTQKLVERMCENDAHHRFLAVVGPSGSGKSSLVKAGLIPALWKGAIDGSEKWFVVDMIPGTHPLDKLETALIRVAANQAHNLDEQLQRDARGLLRVADIILPGDESELVIVVDQFEEVFTLVEDEDTRQQFLDLLRIAVDDKRSRVRVVVTLRADYYDRPLHYPEFGELVRSRMETVLPLTAKGLERAVRGPAERVGTTFEQGLVEQIVSAMNYQSGALPLLQYALTELFDRRQGRLLTHSAYKQIGGAVGALANRADEIYEDLTEEAQELAHQMFMRLVTLGEGAEDTRRRTAHSELLSLTDNTDLMEEIIDQFADYRLLSLDHDPETRQPTVEVAHEAILREWEQLRTWLNDSREDIRQERIVARASDEWETHGYDASYLLSGSRLERVEYWYKVTRLTLTPSEKQFIKASIEERDQRRQADEERKAREIALEQRAFNRMRALLSVFVGATIISLALLVLLSNALNNAEAERKNVQRISLVAQARVLQNAGESTELIALMALRSLSMGYSTDADEVLLEAYSNGFPIVSYVHTTEFSPDSKTLTSDGRHILIGTNDNKVIMWNIQTGTIDKEFIGHTEWVVNAILTADNQQMLSASGDGTVRAWDMDSGETLFVLPNHDATVSDLALTPDEKTIVTGDTKGIVRLWDYETQQLLHSYQAHDTNIFDLVITADGRELITSSCDNIGQLRLWDIESGIERIRYEGHDDCVRSVQLTADGKYMVSAGFDNTARLWNVESGQELQQYLGHTDRLEGIDISPDGRYLLSGSWDRSARLWDINTGETLQIFRGQPDLYGVVRFLPNGHQIVLISFNQVQTWNLQRSNEPSILTPFYNPHNSDSILMEFHNDDSQLRTVSANGGMRIWDIETSQEISVRELEIPLSLDIEFLQGGNRIVNATSSGVLQIWDVGDEKQMLDKEIQVGQLRQMVVNTDESVVATAGVDGIARLWDLETGKLVREYDGHSAEILSIALSDDGNRLITGGGDMTAIVWDVQSGEQLHQLEAHTNIISSVAISNDNHYAVTGSHDTTVILWNLTTGARLHQFTELSSAIHSVVFSPSSQLLFASGGNGVSMLWDMKSKDVVRQLTEHTTAMNQVVFSDDGHQIATSDVVSTYIWQTNLDDIVSIVCNQLRRDFSEQERVAYGIVDNNPTCSNSDVDKTSNQGDATPFPTIAPEDIIPIQITPQSYLNINNPSGIVEQTEPVFWLGSGITLDQSIATLTRTERGVAATYDAREMVPGDVVTLWWVVWEYPERCSQGICNPDDIFLTDDFGNFLLNEKDYRILNQDQIDYVGISILYATGNIVKDDGTTKFNAFLPAGDQTGQTAFGPGLLQPFTSDVHLVARSHGIASSDPNILYQQLNTGWGGCEPMCRFTSRCIPTCQSIM